MGAFNVPVSWNIDVSIGMNVHEFMAPGAPAPVLSPSVEGLVTMAWIPGHLLGANRVATSVGSAFLGSRTWVQDGHDVGPMVPTHLTVAQLNILDSVNFLFASRRIVFKSPTVQANGKETACASHLLPMKTCGQIADLPTAFVLTNMCRNTTVGMSIRALMTGIFDVLSGVAVDVIFAGNRLALLRQMNGPGCGTLVRTALVLPRFKDIATIINQMARRQLRAVSKEAGREVRKAFAKRFKAPVTARGACRIAMSGARGFAVSSLHGDPTFKAKARVGAWADGGVTVSRAPGNDHAVGELKGKAAGFGGSARAKFGAFLGAGSW